MDRINHTHPIHGILKRIEIVDEFIACVEDESVPLAFKGLKPSEFTAQLEALFEDSDNRNFYENVGQAVLNEVLEFRKVLMRDIEPYRPQMVEMGLIEDA